MTVLVTGAVGFIGFHTSRALSEGGDKVLGVENLNDYFDVSLKQTRLVKVYFRSRDTAVLMALPVNFGFWGSVLFNFSFWSVWWQVS